MTEFYERTWALDDIEITRTGDGRTVTAYAAVFDTPAEIRDQYGHYMEEIDRSAFARTLSHGIDKVSVFYNHGLTIHGTPSDLGSVPIGKPLEIKADGRGLLTVSRYNRSELADAVLESIRNGDVRGQSFRGRIFKSTPNRVPKASRAGDLPTVRRTELGLSEYGPTPAPAYRGAEIVAVRTAAALAADLGNLDEATRAELLRILAGTPAASPATSATSAELSADLGSVDSRDLALAHSGRLSRLARNRIRADLIARGVRNGT